VGLEAARSEVAIEDVDHLGVLDLVRVRLRLRLRLRIRVRVT